MIYGWCVQAHWPEENSKFGSTAGWLFALKGYGGLVWSLQALLHFFQHALVDGRPLIGWSDFMHASECGCLPLAAACVHWGEVNCLTSNWIFNVQAMEKSSFLKKKKKTYNKNTTPCSVLGPVILYHRCQRGCSTLDTHIHIGWRNPPSLLFVHKILAPHDSL